MGHSDHRVHPRRRPQPGQVPGRVLQLGSVPQRHRRPPERRSRSPRPDRQPEPPARPGRPTPQHRSTQQHQQGQLLVRPRRESGNKHPRGLRIALPRLPRNRPDHHRHDLKRPVARQGRSSPAGRDSRMLPGSRAPVLARHRHRLRACQPTVAAKVATRAIRRDRRPRASRGRGGRKVPEIETRRRYQFDQREEIGTLGTFRVAQAVILGIAAASVLGTR